MILHIIPLNDLEEHEESSTCKCDPSAQIVNEEIIITHNSFDRRELIEKLLDS